MWCSSIGEECNSSQVYCQPKRWFQKSQEFSNDLENGFWSGKMEGEKMDSHRKVLKMFSPLKILNFPFSKERLLELFFLSHFFYGSFFLHLFLLHLFIEYELKDFWNVWAENNFKLSFKWDESGYTKIYLIGELRKIYRRWMCTLERTYARQ
jgi:hypothetical protein